ncbi:hypothetical protein HDU76_006588 [Blyttiomyces sp. JEL0837]|nr:hypothetical protein HDU76_006588 [Blyttiomyces sp. JEL0837]
MSSAVLMPPRPKGFTVGWQSEYQRQFTWKQQQLLNQDLYNSKYPSPQTEQPLTVAGKSFGFRDGEPTAARLTDYQADSKGPSKKGKVVRIQDAPPPVSVSDEDQPDAESYDVGYTSRGIPANRSEHQSNQDDHTRRMGESGNQPYSQRAYGGSHQPGRSHGRSEDRAWDASERDETVSMQRPRQHEREEQPRATATRRQPDYEEYVEQPDNDSRMMEQRGYRVEKGGKPGSYAPQQIVHYGQGNGNPVNEDLFMKTYNVTAPAAEQRKERPQKPARQQYGTESQIAFRNLVEANRRSAMYSTGFQTEYQREFLNWTAALTVQGKGMSGKKPTEQQNLEGPSNRTSGQRRQEEYTDEQEYEGERGPSNPDRYEDHRDRELEYSQRKSKASKVPAALKKKPAGVESYTNRDIGTRHYDEVYQPDQIQKQRRDMDMQLTVPVVLPPERQLREDEDEYGNDYMRVDRRNKKDESHPTYRSGNDRVYRYAPEPPTTWRLAQDLLRRARERAARNERMDLSEVKGASL